MKTTPIITVSSNDYAIGTCVLLNSIFHHNPELSENETIILYDSAISPLSKAWQEIMISSFNNIKFQDTSDLEELHCIKINMTRLQYEPRLKAAFLKLYTFSLHQYDQIVFLDSDIVCEGNISTLFEKRSGIAGTTGGINGRSWRGNFLPEFINTGVLSIGRDYLNPGFYKKLNRFKAPILADPAIGPADQAVINYLIPHTNFEKLSPRLNFSKHFLNNELFATNTKLHSPSLIHYVSEKPWQTESTESFYQYAYKIWHSALESFLKKSHEAGTLIKLAKGLSITSERPTLNISAKRTADLTRPLFKANQSPKTNNDARDEWKKYKKSISKRRCLILRNSKSLPNLAPYATEDYFVISTAGFEKTREADALPPDICLLPNKSDLFTTEATEPVLRLENYRPFMRRARHSKAVLPITSQPFVDSTQALDTFYPLYLNARKKIKFNGDPSSINWKDIFAPVIDLGCVELSMALRIAVYLGFQDIQLIGLTHNNRQEAPLKSPLSNLDIIKSCLLAHEIKVSEGSNLQ